MIGCASISWRAICTRLPEASRAGIRIDGYFIWSFLDHFEWDLGYTTRWGIVHVDFPTQRRTLKPAPTGIAG